MIMARWTLALLLGLGSVALAQQEPASSTEQQRETVILAEPETVFALGGESPMRLPTAVAVGPGGQVYVADGVNRRVLEFDARGVLQRQHSKVGAVSLRNPVDVAVSADGTLWIADPDLGAVVARAPSGAGRVISLAEGADPTGLAVSPAGDMLWIVDNESHRLLHGRPDRGRFARIGEPGKARGQLHYPFMVALDDAGAIYVSDVLNGRVQAFSDNGRSLRTIGRYGIDPGQLHRPKGVAVSGDRVWVSDSDLGVVQVFSLEGRLEDVLRGPDGEVLKLDTPTGIAVEGDRLYVVEARADRVRSFRIHRGEGRPLRADLGVRAGTLSSKDQECSVCHLNLFPALERGLSTELISPPPNSEQQPYVSRPESCLSCHDGSVKDSRRAVWSMYGHPLDEAPPEAMVIPEQLPLRDGEMACRTCHSAHTLAGSGQFPENPDAVFLRVDTDAEELCEGCHADMVEVER
jgi:DNA-binding beta-propeller fold protein YncE